METKELSFMVRVTGLEPACLSAQEPKSCVSANFTIPACFIQLYRRSVYKDKSEAVFSQVDTELFKSPENVYTAGFYRREREIGKNAFIFCTRLAKAAGAAAEGVGVLKAIVSHPVAAFSAYFGYRENISA